MAKKKTTPLKPTRAIKRAYAKAVVDASEDLALKRNDPIAIMESARRKVAAELDKQAATNPSAARAVRFAKHGNFRRF